MITFMHCKVVVKIRGHSLFKCYVTLEGWGVSAFPEKSVTKVYGSTLLALRGGPGGWGSNFQEKKHYVTLESPLKVG